MVDLQGGHVQGGSTITQQLVKNVYTGGARSFRRKFMEAALAYQLEQEWPKRRILTAYLNTVFFGHHAYGVEAAAQIYFGTHARSLQPWQAALLAGLVKGPSEYDPVAHPYQARARRNLVLRLMLQEGKISATDYAFYIRKPVIPKGRKVELPATTRGVAPYFTQYVIDQLVARYGQERVFGGGLRVYTTIDLKLQAAAAKAVKLKLKHVGPSGALVSIDPTSGQIKVMVGGANYRQSQFNLAAQARRQPGSAFKPFVLLAALQAGIQPQTVFDSKPQFIQTGGTVVPITNDEGSYLGWIPLSTAMTYSDNAVYTQLAVRVGLGKVRAMAHRLGITSPLDAEPGDEPRRPALRRVTARDGPRLRDDRRRGRARRRVAAVPREGPGRAARHVARPDRHHQDPRPQRPARGRQQAEAGAGGEPRRRAHDR